MQHKLETTASADWRTEYGHNRIATAAHGRIDHTSTDHMTTNSTASADRADHTDSRHAPTDDEVEQLVQILLDRLDEQGSPTYIRQQRVNPDAVAPPRRGHAFRAIDRDPDVPIACSVWSEHSTLWQVRRVTDQLDDVAAAGGRA
jgi:hypothetical protein